MCASCEEASVGKRPKAIKGIDKEGNLIIRRKYFDVDGMGNLALKYRYRYSGVIDSTQQHWLNIVRNRDNKDDTIRIVLPKLGFAEHDVERFVQARIRERFIREYTIDVSLTPDQRALLNWGKRHGILKAG